MAQKFYDVNICTKTVLKAIEWLDLAVNDKESHYMEIARNAIDIDPCFQWKGVEPKLKSKYNYRLKKAISIFEI